MNIGKLIKDFRLKNNLTQTAFGRIVGVNKQTVSKWENGTIQPSSEKFFEIAHAIGISANNMLTDEVQNEENAPFIFAHKIKYDVGLNFLYRCTHDFKSLGAFVDAMGAAHRLMKPNSEIMGFLLINTTFESKDSHETAIPINSVYWNGEDIIVETSYSVLQLTEEKISHVECVTNFNNESYAFNINLIGEQDAMLQLILSF